MDGGLEHIRKKLAVYQPQERGDYTLDARLLPPPPYQEAAVLIPLIKHGDSYTVLFTQRAAHLHAHGGQVSFPGGRVDQQDKGSVATALREAREEIGLLPENVSVLGTLDQYITGTGFRVTPVVGVIEKLQDWVPDTSEVAEIFEVPLSHILNPDILTRQTLMKGGLERDCYALTWNNFQIWGATAGMLRNFVDIVTHDNA